MHRYDFGLSLFGFGTFVSCALITRSARRELKRFGNAYNVNYSHRPNKLVNSGIYRYSRHPIYLGVMLRVIGAPLCLHTTMVPLYKRKSDNYIKYIYGFWFANAVAALGFFDRIEIPREEAVLRDTFGKRYTDYKEETSRWLGGYNEKRRTCNAGSASKRQKPL